MSLLRKINSLGQIEIPKDFRKFLNIEEDKECWLELELIGEGIYIKKKKFKYEGDIKDESK